MPQMLHEHFACARSGPFPFRSRSVPRSVFGPAFPEISKSLRGHKAKQVLKTSNGCFYHGCLEVVHQIVAS